MVALAGGVIARSADQSNRKIGLWHTSDGVEWEPVSVLDTPGDGHPVAIHQGDDEAIATLLTTAGFTNWSTTDRTSFHRLPDVQGVTHRTRGTDQQVRQ